MDKRVINKELQYAYTAIKEAKIANSDDKIQRKYRGYISSFGAAIIMGSLLSAIAFMGKDEDRKDEDRKKLMNAILMVLKENGKISNDVTSLFDYAKKECTKGCKEEILNATIAVKLAMNLYEFIDNEEEAKS